MIFYYLFFDNLNFHSFLMIFFFLCFRFKAIATALSDYLWVVNLERLMIFSLILFYFFMPFLYLHLNFQLEDFLFIYFSFLFIATIFNIPIFFQFLSFIFPSTPIFFFLAKINKSSIPYITNKYAKVLNEITLSIKSPETA